MHPDELPARRLPRKTEQQLQVAVGAVAHIFGGFGPIQEDFLDLLMDLVADTLTKEQRRDPSSIMSPEVLGRIERVVKIGYGLEVPVNIHAAPLLNARAREAVGAESEETKDNPLNRNRFGLSKLDQTLVGMEGSYRRDYSGIDPRYWNPTTGAAGLTTTNFGSTDFARAGLDLPTTQFLFGQGFNAPQILHAGQDAKALGLNPRDRQTVQDFATLDRFDPTGRAQRNDAYSAYDKWLKDHQRQIAQYQAAIDSAPDDAARAKAKADYAQFLKGGQDQNGVTAVGTRLATVAPAPDAKPDDRKNAIAGHNRTVQQIQDNNKATGLDQAQKAGIDPALVDAARRGDAAASAQLTAAAADPDKAPVVAQLMGTIAQNDQLQATVVAQVADQAAQNDAALDDLNSDGPAAEPTPSAQPTSLAQAPSTSPAVPAPIEPSAASERPETPAPSAEPAPAQPTAVAEAPKVPAAPVRKPELPKASV